MANRFLQLLFDQFIGGTTDEAVSPLETWAVVSMARRIHVQVGTSDVSGSSPTLTLALQESNDGRIWKSVSNLLTNQALSGLQTHFANWDGAGRPLARFARLRATLGGSSPSARVAALAYGDQVA